VKVFISRLVPGGVGSWYASEDGKYVSLVAEITRETESLQHPLGDRTIDQYERIHGSQMG
jgi:hypothetical protein